MTATDPGAGTGPGPARTGFWTGLAPTGAAPIGTDRAATPGRRDGRTGADRVELDRGTPNAGYGAWLAVLLAIAAATDRGGSRTSFSISAVAVIVALAAVWQWRIRSAPTHVDIDGAVLAIVWRRRVQRIPIAALIRVDHHGSTLAQFLGWPELTIHHVAGRVRIGRPRDWREFTWQLSKHNDSVVVEPPSARQRPWIVTAVVAVVGVTVLATAMLAAAELSLPSLRGHGFAILVGAVFRGALCIRLWRGSRRARLVLVALALLALVVDVAYRELGVALMVSDLVLLAALSSPGLRRWASV